MYWTNPVGVDVAFSGLGSDNACELTTCPTVSGTQQLLDYTLYIGKKLPKVSIFNKMYQANIYYKLATRPGFAL